MNRKVLALAATLLAARAHASGGQLPSALPGFDQAPFVSPRVVQDLMPWVSDQGEQVVAIDLVGAAGANRYFGDFEVQPMDGGHPEVAFAEKAEEGRRPAFFRYRLVGTTTSGIHVLRVARGTGGTGVFESLLLLRIERERALSYDAVRHVARLDRERTVLRRLGGIPLGDRYGGEVSVRGDAILIARDERTPSSGWWKQDGIVRVEEPGREKAH